MSFFAFTRRKEDTVYLGLLLERVKGQPGQSCAVKRMRVAFVNNTSGYEVVRRIINYESNRSRCTRECNECTTQFVP